MRSAPCNQVSTLSWPGDFHEAAILPTTPSMAQGGLRRQTELVLASLFCLLLRNILYVIIGGKAALLSP